MNATDGSVDSDPRATLPCAVVASGSLQRETELSSGPSRNKGKGKAVVTTEDYEDYEDHQPPILPHTDEQAKTKRKKHHRRKNKTAQVTLLQTTLRSTQFERVGKQMRLPVSGHWAVEIRGEVFELNRGDTWSWTFASGSFTDYTTPFGNPFGDNFTAAYISLLQRLTSVFRLRPQAGSFAKIDVSRYEDYLKERKQWTTPQFLGTTTMKQSFIKESKNKNEDKMFYSIFSNNCQHFILDLCDYIELVPQEPLSSLGVASENSGMDSGEGGEFLQDYSQTKGQFKRDNIQNLWIKSRLVFLVGSGLHFLLSFMLPIITVVVSELGEAHGNKILLICFLVLPFYGFATWLSFSAIVIGHEALQSTVDRYPYPHSTCFTGPLMRRHILASPSRYNHALERFLLRMEKFPYSLYLLLGYVLAIPVTIAQVNLPSMYLKPDSRWLPRQSWVGVQVGFHGIFILSHCYDMLLQARKLSNALQSREREDEDESQSRTGPSGQTHSDNHDNHDNHAADSRGRYIQAWERGRRLGLAVEGLFRKRVMPALAYPFAKLIEAGDQLEYTMMESLAARRQGRIALNDNQDGPVAS